MSKQTIKNLKLSSIQRDENQPRKSFNESSLSELAESIKKHGVIQPITVQSLDKGYVIVMGERRFRASKIAGKKTIPCIVSEFASDEVQEIQIIENLQREDVDVIEESEAISYLMDKYSPGEISKRIGGSVSFVYQRIKLGKLIEPFKKLVRDNRITLEKALKIAAFSSEDQNTMIENLEDDFSNYQLDHLISDKVFNLEKAPFDIADEKLLPKAGACTTCPFNAANIGDLFGEGKPVCTKAVCFETKKSKALTNHIEHCKKTNEMFIPEIFSWNLEDANNQIVIQAMEKHNFNVFCSYQVDCIEKPEKPTLDQIINDNFFNYDEEEDREEAEQDLKDALEAFENETKEYKEAKNNGYQSGLLFDTSSYTTTKIFVKIPVKGEKKEVHAIPVSQKKMDDCTPGEKIEKIKAREVRKKEIEGGREFEEIVSVVGKNRFLDLDKPISEDEKIAFCITAFFNNVGWYSRDLFKDEKFFELDCKDEDYFEKFKEVYHEGIYNKIVRFFLHTQVILGESTPKTNRTDNAYYTAVKPYYKKEIEAVENAYKERERTREEKMQKRIDELEKQLQNINTK